MKERIVYLFKAMEYTYGNAWKRQFVDVDDQKQAMRFWAKDLSKYSDAQIKLAITKCKDPGRQLFYPPTLPRFKSLCFIDMYDLGVYREEGFYMENDKVWQSISSWDRQHKTEYELRKLYADAHRFYLDKKLKALNSDVDNNIVKLSHYQQDALMIE